MIHYYDASWTPKWEQKENKIFRILGKEKGKKFIEFARKSKRFVKKGLKLIFYPLYKINKRKKIVITGGLIELDKKYVQYNELIGEKLNDLDYIYLINKNYNHPLIKKIDKNKLMVFKSLIQAYSELDKNKEESILLLLCKGNDLYLK